MNKAFSIGLFVAGIVVIIFGVNASNSVGSSFTRAFTGNPTNHSMWLLVAGIAMAVVGLILSLRGSRNG